MFAGRLGAEVFEREARNAVLNDGAVSRGLHGLGRHSGGGGGIHRPEPRRSSGRKDGRCPGGLRGPGCSGRPRGIRGKIGERFPWRAWRAAPRPDPHTVRRTIARNVRESRTAKKGGTGEGGLGLGRARAGGERA